jgi:ketosteroid isomerase-like protein
VVSRIWGGKANLVELEVDGPAGHIEGLSLRLYNPQSHQWSLNFASSRGGSFGMPTVGEFENGVGTFYDEESINGRMVLVRNVWSEITRNSGRFEQAFSEDGGRSWEVNWIASDTLVDASAIGDALPPELAAALSSFDRAHSQSDLPRLSSLVTDDYVLVNSDASIENKEQFLADFRLPGFKIEPYVRREPTNKVWDCGAVTAATVHLSWTQDGVKHTRGLRYADVWIRKNGRWQVTFTQVTRVP